MRCGHTAGLRQSETGEETQSRGEKKREEKSAMQRAAGATMRAAATRGATTAAVRAATILAPPTPSALAHCAFAASPLLRVAVLAHRSSHALLFHSNARAFNTAEPAAAEADADSAAAPPAAEPVPKQNKTFRLPLWADAPKPQLISLDNLQPRPQKRVRIDAHTHEAERGGR